jgi:thiamine pyrophosphokinase
MILMDTYSLMIYLKPGDHLIIPSAKIEAKVGCGFYPICSQSSMVATEGLKWNVGVYSQPQIMLQ